MLQQYVHKHNSTTPGTFTPVSVAGVTNNSLVIINRDDVYAAETSFWVPFFEGTPPEILHVGFVVRADATRLTLESLRDVVFSAAFSGYVDNIPAVFPNFFRLETDDLTRHFSVNDPELHWFPPEFRGISNEPGTTMLNFSDCCSFDALHYTGGTNVYFGVAFTCFGLKDTSYIQGLLSMRCNYSERIPFQPLKA